MPSIRFPAGFALLAPLSLCPILARAEPPAAQTIVLPFRVDAAGADRQWLGSAVQHAVIADLKHATVEPGVASPSDDPAVIARIAKSAGATFVIAGDAQCIGQHIRLTAQVFDRDGHAIKQAKTSGDLEKLFDLEDTLSLDLRDGIATLLRRQNSVGPMPTVAAAGPLRMIPQRPQPVGTVAVDYSTRRLRDGRQRNIYNTPFYEYDGFGCGGYGIGAYGFGGFGLGGFGFGQATVGFATGGSGQGAY